MKKSDIDQKLRDFVKEEVNPNQTELNFVRKIYKTIKKTLGEGNCYRIGSWRRATAIHPLHDLDVLFIAGKDFDMDNPPNPTEVISKTIDLIEEHLEIPKGYTIETVKQSHSCAILYKDYSGEEVFSVDVVPAYIASKNEQGQDTYYIPDISHLGRNEQQLFYEDVEKGVRVIGWKLSDPRGYIQPTLDLSKRNNDFRLAVKFIKYWKSQAKSLQGEDFKLKSFHLEQKLFEYYSHSPSSTIFDSVFYILTEISANSPFFTASIRDRADSEKFIDSYVEDLTDKQKNIITYVRDFSLIGLENITDSMDLLETVLSGNKYIRPYTEDFLFDTKKKVLTEDLRDFEIRGEVLQKGVEEEYFLNDKQNKVAIGRDIRFTHSASFIPKDSKILWKVRNDDDSNEPRGEITKDNTRNNPETTAYPGIHYVEAYLMLDGVCIEKYKQPVIIEE